MATSKQLILPSGVHIYGPAIASDLKVRFDFDCAKNGLFLVIPSPQMTTQIAAEQNKGVFYAGGNDQPYKNYYNQTAPEDGKTYGLRDFTLYGSGSYDTWENGLTFTFNGNSLTASSSHFINGWKYYLIVIQGEVWPH